MDQILLVEDDEAMADSLIFALEAEQFTVRHAATLEEAEQGCKGVDLIILDVSLPDGCGFDFCKRLRQRENCPVIFLTARDDEADIVHGLELGADDYITKPFRLRELIARIHALIRRAKGKNQLPETLTATERRLVHYLQINSDRVVTRNQILDCLWDQHGEFVDDNTLSVHIRRLREKLDTDGVQHIRTVRGIGYQWIES
ncbi:response regulator transcription factor [Ruminococcus sp.]|uniref:response regulator transcription factor n=1 Tax=Ruminococcus sp. TaxID=41978 RepID=UPI0025CD739B|nr:response regulator transcription factor [Ruminococcus sp.]MDD7556656.1 response regulator transcription factor [Ruminococcus sp.]MDY4963541.1 response regulator transcription factor [Ruminococcus callidus]